MATQLETVIAFRPTTPITVAVAPKTSIAQTHSPVIPTTFVGGIVPVIRPYLIARFGGFAAIAVLLDAVQTMLDVGTGGIGALSASCSSRQPTRPGAAGIGAPGAGVSVKSGRVLVAAALSGAGAAAGVLRAIGSAATAGAEGAAGTAISVVTTAEALFGSEGRYSGLAPLTADGVTHGALSIETGAIGAVSVRAVQEGAGQLSAASLSGADTVASGSGALSVTVALPAKLSGAGTLTHTHTARASTPAALAGAGSLSLDVRTDFLPSSMTKNGTWSAMNATFKPITGWLADTQGYPGSTLSGDGLVVQKPKTNALLDASIVLTGRNRDVTVTLQLLVNNNVVVTNLGQPVGGTGTTTVSVSTTQSVAQGDVITLQAKSSQNVTAFNPTATTNPASYVRVV
ncbi:hypothetical protein [Nocardia sp. NPDC052566]|uniref:hypothetical protein n=1 Tax=Nocardia sp. NPDC052566 TaxID=3364330 RepID=UPI0037C813B4